MPLDLVGAAEEIHRLAELLDKGLEALRSYAHAYAEAERDYRKAKAELWVTTPRTRDGEKVTVFDRQAQVDGASADLRMARDLAQDMRQAALEAVRSRRAMLSAVQSLLAAERAEAEFARTGPQ